MAKRPLRAWMRDKLMNHAQEVVQPATEKKAVDTAYRAAAPLVMAIVEKKYPPRDMKLLTKYGVSARHNSAKIQSPGGQVVEMGFVGEDVVTVPNGCGYRQIYLGDDRTVAAIEKYTDAVRSFKAEYEKRVGAFRTLLFGSAYVEDVIEVWPEAAKVIPANEMTAQLAPEQIAIIKADMRERRAA